MMKTKELFDEDTSGWLVSLLGHVIVLLTLALIVPDVQEIVRPIMMIASQSDEIVEVDSDEFVVSDLPTEEAGSGGEVGQELAMASVPASEEPQEILSVDVETEISESPLEVPISDLSATISTKGQISGVATNGAAGAMDILAAEIEASLNQRPTVVCWVFDQSLSLVEQRNDIADRLDNAFGQIKTKGLRNMVVSFGEKVNFVVKSPTKETSSVINAIKNIPIDLSGKEMTFHAVMATAEAAKVYRSDPKNNVMIVVFTDEVANDRELCDKASQQCRIMGVPVYVVGVPAPFGMDEVRIKYVENDPKFSQEVQWAVVNQGPESLFPEFVRLPKDEAVDSGFGPYHLSRLCMDTGGAYLRIHPNADSRERVTNEQVGRMASQIRLFFDPSTMASYRPDYRAKEKIESEIKSDRCKRSLVMASSEAIVHPLESPRMIFPKEDDGSLANLFSEAQKAAAVVQPRIDRIYNILHDAEDARSSLKEKRWRAGYDLALGRILAAKVRADSYNMMLAQAKSGLKFKQPKMDTWELVPSNKVSTGSRTEKDARQATFFLERVISEHPGTPWAYYAMEELKTPLGYEWVERWTNVKKEKMGAGGNNVPTAGKDDQKKMLAPPKPPRNLKNI